MEQLRDVVDMDDVTTAVHFKQNTVDRGCIDVVIADTKTFIEQKSPGISLDKEETRQGRMVTPFKQAKKYADSMPNSQRPYTIIVCDFNEFHIHDLDTEKPGEHYTSYALDELPDNLSLLDFLVDPQRARRVREQQVSGGAGTLVGKLYKLLRAQYLDPDSDKSQHALNVLCVCLVFCLFAEDAGLFTKDAFYRYLNSYSADQMRLALNNLFAWPDTPNADRDPYATELLAVFPYVNGGLFRDDGQDEIPRSYLKSVTEGSQGSENQS